MSSPITVVAGDANLTGRYEDLSFSNVDPGGYEQLQITVADVTAIKEGDTITVRCGLETAWRGRVNEIGAHEAGGRVTYQLAALGDGAELTDKRLQMIYADRDLSHWQGMSRSRRVVVTTGAYQEQGSWDSQPDQFNALPAITQRFQRIVTTAGGGPFALIETWYDAAGLPIDVLYLDTAVFNVGTPAAGWGAYARLSDNDSASGTTDLTANLAGSSSAGYLGSTTQTRLFASVLLSYTNTFTGDSEWRMYWRNLTVYGLHNLTRRGVDPGGFYPADIVGHALSDSGAGFELVADDSSSLIVRHAVYRDPVAHQTVIADMAKLMGWHYGVWEPRTTLDDTPRLLFTAPPASPTCVVTRAEISDLDAPAVRVDLLYDTAKVKWQDAAGTSGIATVTITNPVAARAGVSGRTLDLDMGLGDATSATTFATFALNLALAGARGGGSGTVPDTVKLPGGGSKPACLLKAGRDKIRIIDLPDSGSLTADDTDRQDSFLVRRVETTVKSEVPFTRVEFDGGADLLEVLQARLALSAFGGASGAAGAGEGGIG